MFWVGQMRKLLFVSYYFPPALTSESLRALRTVKYLPRWGWEPIVLAAFLTKQVERNFDKSLLSELPKGIAVHRVYSFANRFSNFALRRIGAFLRWSCLPLYNIEWVPFAVLKGEKILKKEIVEAVISRSIPFASHLVALRLKSFYKVPWVADFSDPWTQNPYFRSVRAFDESLERKVALAADRVIFTNRFAQEQFLGKYKNVEEEKVIVIPNQFDEENFARRENGTVSEVFTIVHTGSLYGIRSPETFFKALTTLKDKKDYGKKTKVKLIGAVHRKFRFLISKYGLQDLVEVIDAVPYKDVLHHLLTADVLLLIDAPVDEPSPFLPLKLVEYIRAAKPILAITPLEGASGDVVRSTKTGRVVSPNDIKGIKDAIEEFFQQYKTSKLGIRPCWNEIEKYNASNCTKNLVGVLKELTDLDSSHSNVVNGSLETL